MSRRPRLTLAGVPLPIIQRGNNRSACFWGRDDDAHSLTSLHHLCQQGGVKVHASGLMTHHVHLLVTPPEAQSASWLMKHLGQWYVQDVNRTSQRPGTLWEGRFRSCLVEAEFYLLVCQRSIALHPVRAGMVTHPAAYRWSSYRAHAEGATSALLTPHACDVALGADDATRQAAYRELFREAMASRVVEDLRAATNGGSCVGDERLNQDIATRLKRRVEPGKPGALPDGWRRASRTMGRSP